MHLYKINDTVTANPGLAEYLMQKIYNAELKSGLIKALILIQKCQ